MLKNELLKKIYRKLQSGGSLTLYIFANLFIIIFEFIYILLRINYLNFQIPLWYTNGWGLTQLAQRSYIYVIPYTSFAIFALGLVAIFLTKKYYIRYSYHVIAILSLGFNLLLGYSFSKIFHMASAPFKPMIDPNYVELFLPFIFAFFVVYFVTPIFIEYAKENNLVTNPSVHNHPGMVLTKPSARGGGLVFTFGVVAAGLIFLTVSREIFGLLLGCVVLATLGFFDDFQNTHPTSKFKVLENPLIRLLALFSVIYYVISFGIRFDFIANPFSFGGIIDLASFKFIPDLLTVIWIVWVLNVLSWSNGIDGQYSGIVGIVGVIVAMLALRFGVVDPAALNIAKFAAIVAGASFALVPFSWYPSRIMWGFGAMSAGLALSGISILINSKVTTSVLVILIPFLDAVVTVVRRIIQGKNPLAGDKGHLHHLLMQRGWGVRRIATFYWLTTLVFGLISLLVSDIYIVQATLLLAGGVAFFIIALNFLALKKN